METFWKYRKTNKERVGKLMPLLANSMANLDAEINPENDGLSVRLVIWQSSNVVHQVEAMTRYVAYPNETA